MAVAETMIGKIMGTSFSYSIAVSRDLKSGDTTVVSTALFRSTEVDRISIVGSLGIPELGCQDGPTPV